jgi:DNA-binding MarR family transcriptional regulator
MVTMPTITPLADSLVEKGWVERRLDPQDRRRWLLSITTRGLQAHDEYTKTLESHLAQALARLESKKCKRLAQALAELAELSAELVGEVPVTGRSR